MKKITLLMLIVFTITMYGQDKLLSSIRELPNNGNWEIYSGENYEYDNNKNLTSETELSFEDGIWKTAYKTIYTYNVENKVTQEIGQEWNEVTNQLENSWQINYAYTNGKLTGIEDLGWDDSIKYFKASVTYNSNNLPEIVLFYYWNGSIWVNESQSTYTYNVNNKIITSIDQNWEENQWVNSRKSLYTYNAKNKLITVKGADWDEFNNNWVVDDYNEYDYELDAQGNRISETEESYYRTDYTYDTTMQINNFSHPFRDKTGVDYFSEDYPFINKLLTSTDLSVNEWTNSFEISSRTTYNYNNAILSTNYQEIANKGIIVYPNPATSILNFQNPDKITLDKINIIDCTGKMVLQESQNLNSINIENLAKGLYVIQSFSGKEKHQTKFIKE